MALGQQTQAEPGLSEDQARGLALACSSAVFIGSSFIIKKKGLRVAGASGTRAGAQWSPLVKSSLLTVLLMVSFYVTTYACSCQQWRHSQLSA